MMEGGAAASDPPGFVLTGRRSGVAENAAEPCQTFNTMRSTTIEAPLDDLRWPQCCCRCGSSTFRLREHVENVVSWTVVAVTAYRKIGVRIPVCRECAWRRNIWFGAAALVVAATLGTGPYRESISYGGLIMGALMFAAIGMVLYGLNAQPVRLLSFASDTKALTLRVYSPRTADALLAAPGAQLGSYKAVRSRYLYALGLTLILMVAAVVIKIASR